MKKNMSTIILIGVFLIGLSLLLYPTVSDYWNSFRQTRAITNYAENVSNMDQEVYKEIWANAIQYNIDRSGQTNTFTLTEEQKKQYEQLLNIGGTGEMGYIEIPSIKVSLPIYHGTDEMVLQHAIGHLEWSSLPVGGSGSHCVLSGHRGLPSAKLFTNLDRLVEGDTFILRVLNEVLTYEVDQILIVDPKDTGALQIVDGKDYCTLVTCTPYGINTHRMLVRGHRIDNSEEARTVYITSDAMQVEPLMVASAIAVPILLVLLVLLMLPGRSRKKHGGDNDDDL